MSKSLPLPRNIKLMYAIITIGGMLFYLPILSLYYKGYIESLTDVALIFAIQAFSVVVLEVPTGAIADLFGRKRTILLSSVTALISIVVLYYGRSFEAFALYGVLYAIEHALWSGSDQAFMYDSLKEVNQEHKYKKVIGNYYALWPLGAAIGSIIGGYIAAVSFSLAIALALIPHTITLIITFFLKEPKYHKEEHRNVFKQIGDSIKIIGSSKQLLILLFGFLVLWGVGEVHHEFKPIFFEDRGITILHFGYLAAIAFGLSSLGSFASHAVSEKFGNKKTLITALAIVPIFTIIATQTSGFLSGLFFVLPSFVWGIQHPIADHFIQSEVSSSKRATISSAFSLIGHFGVAAFSPFIGYAADLYSLNTAMLFSSFIIFLVPISFAYIRDIA